MSEQARKALLVPAGEGRAYNMGRMSAVFKADEGETGGRYSISEWRLEPRTRGPGEHSHGDDHVFHVLEGTLGLCLDGAWSSLDAGGYAIVPGGTPHDFRNESDAPARFISLNLPGGFEARMPDIEAALSAEDLALD
ncbi:MAG: cupin domain-containing protein [Allosphingosinicella sp.]